MRILKIYHFKERRIRMEDFEVKNEGVIYRMEEKLDIMDMVQVSQHLNKKRNILSFIIVILFN